MMLFLKVTLVYAVGNFEVLAGELIRTPCRTPFQPPALQDVSADRGKLRRVSRVAEYADVQVAVGRHAVHQVVLHLDVLPKWLSIGLRVLTLIRLPG
jgi:hypothetical protein